MFRKGATTLADSCKTDTNVVKTVLVSPPGYAKRSRRWAGPTGRSTANPPYADAAVD